MKMAVEVPEELVEILKSIRDELKAVRRLMEASGGSISSAGAVASSRSAGSSSSYSAPAVADLSGNREPDKQERPVAGLSTSPSPAKKTSATETILHESLSSYDRTEESGAPQTSSDSEPEWMSDEPPKTVRPAASEPIARPAPLSGVPDKSAPYSGATSSVSSDPVVSVATEQPEEDTGHDDAIMKLLGSMDEPDADASVSDASVSEESEPVHAPPVAADTAKFDLSMDELEKIFGLEEDKK